MLFLIALVVVYAATWLIPPRSRWTPQKRWRYALAAGMAVFGALHMIAPTPFLQHIPPWVPAREALVIASGLMEIAFGVALIWSTTLRPWIGYALAAYLVAVFPGNIYVAVAGIDVAGQPDGAYPWIRLAFQPLFVWLAVWTTPSHRPLPDRIRPPVRRAGERTRRSEVQTGSRSSLSRNLTQR